MILANASGDKCVRGKCLLFLTLPLRCPTRDKTILLVFNEGVGLFAFIKGVIWLLEGYPFLPYPENVTVNRVLRRGWRRGQEVTHRRRRGGISADFCEGEGETDL